MPYTCFLQVFTWQHRHLGKVMPAIINRGRPDAAATSEPSSHTVVTTATEQPYVSLAPEVMATAFAYDLASPGLLATFFASNHLA
jgi:hypothetical protein